MNPEDRSVDEIDAAMERRWAKVALHPDKEVVKLFLAHNKASASLVGATIDFFIVLQKHVQVGHAFFKSVRDKESLQRLWDTQISQLVRKRFRFDPDTLRDIEALWSDCITRIAPAGAPAIDGPEGNSDLADDGQPVA